MTIKTSLIAALTAGTAMQVQAANYQVYVTNEMSGDVTVINGGDFRRCRDHSGVVKRPRGIHLSPDGKTVYVALSGTPIEAPRRSTRTAIRYSKGERALMTTRMQTKPRMASAY